MTDLDKKDFQIKLPSLSREAIERKERQLAVFSKDALRAFKKLQAEIAEMDDPSTEREFLRLGIRLEVVSEKLKNVAEMLR
jgi:hypothetical protein